MLSREKILQREKIILREDEVKERIILIHLIARISSYNRFYGSITLLMKFFLLTYVHYVRR